MYAAQDSKGRRMSRRVSGLILGEAFVRAAGGPSIVDTNHDDRLAPGPLVRLASSTAAYHI